MLRSTAAHRLAPAWCFCSTCSQPNPINPTRACRPPRWHPGGFTEGLLSRCIIGIRPSRGGLAWRGQCQTLLQRHFPCLHPPAGAAAARARAPVTATAHRQLWPHSIGHTAPHPLTAAMTRRQLAWSPAEPHERRVAHPPLHRLLLAAPPLSLS
jgi:hypothetical protein